MIEPGMRTPPADSKLAVNEKYIEAVNLNARIHISAQAAQQNLYDMCMGFKEMRDSKLYKELGYQNFETYCEKEAGFTPKNVYRYISVVEKLPSDFVTSMSQIGMTKLALLSTLDENSREELTAKTDLENTSVRELENEIKQLKADKTSLQQKLDDSGEIGRKYAEEANQCKQKITQLESEIKTLESRPVDVAVVDNSDAEKRLQETIKSLERENIRQNEALEESYRRQEQDVRRMLEQEKQDKLSQLKAELEKTRADYEKKLAEKASANSDSDDKVKFKIYLTAAFDAMKRLTEYAKSCNNDMYCEKVRQLLAAAENELEVQK